MKTPGRIKNTVYVSGTKNYEKGGVTLYVTNVPKVYQKKTFVAFDFDSLGFMNVMSSTKNDTSHVITAKLYENAGGSYYEKLKKYPNGFPIAGIEITKEESNEKGVYIAKYIDSMEEEEIGNLNMQLVEILMKDYPKYWENLLVKAKEKADKANTASTPHNEEDVPAITAEEYASYDVDTQKYFAESCGIYARTKTQRLKQLKNCGKVIG